MPKRDDAIAVWAKAADELTWDRPWDELLDESAPPGRWFAGGTLNSAVNCVYRHLPKRVDDVAIYWEGEPGDRQVITYGELAEEVSRLAAALIQMGVKAGDTVALHLGWIPELVISMLACGQVGAIHSILPVPLPPEAIAARLEVLRPRVLFTQDAAWRRGELVPLKSRADDALGALTGADVVRHQVVVRRTEVDVDWYEGDRSYADVVRAAPREVSWPKGFASTHPLSIDFLAQHPRHSARAVHGTAGVLVCASLWHRSLTVTPGDVLWCAAEVSHLTSVVHGICGPLCCGASAVMYEGALDTPNSRRSLEIVERYGVQVLLSTAPVLHRVAEWWRTAESDRLGSVRLIVSSGAPIDRSAAEWLGEHVGNGEVVVADAWGQLETGCFVRIEPEPQGRGPFPDPGFDVVDEAGEPVPIGTPGELVMRHPWPGFCLGIEGHSHVTSRYWRYWSHPGTYATGDLVRRKADQSLEFLGRLDQVVKVSGQLVFLADVRQALRDHPFVVDVEVTASVQSEEAVDIVAWVVLEAGTKADIALAGQLQRHVVETLGGLAKPQRVGFVESFPSSLSRRALQHALERLGGRSERWALTVSTQDLEEVLDPPPTQAALPVLGEANMAAPHGRRRRWRALPPGGNPEDIVPVTATSAGDAAFG